MVHKFMDTCSREYLWYKRNTNIPGRKKMKKINAKKQPGLAALKKKRPDVVKKMGYFKNGGKVKNGGKLLDETRATKVKLGLAVVDDKGNYQEKKRKKMMDGGVANHAQLTGFGAVRPEVKKFGKGKK